MTYTIPRYPVHLIDVVRLVDGSRITIRPTLPQDLELQREFFRSLSTQGRYRRFMGPLNDLPEAVARRFTSIDYCSHLALLAEIFKDSREIMIGEARYVVDEDDPAVCEFALAVSDDWQACGIGRCPHVAAFAPNIWNAASVRTRRAQGAVMSPAEFIALVAAWGAGLVLLLFIAALAR